MEFESLNLNANRRAVEHGTAISSYDKRAFQNFLRDVQRSSGQNRIVVNWKDQVKLSVAGEFDSQTLSVSILIDNEFNHSVLIAGACHSDVADEVWDAITDFYEHSTGELALPSVPEATPWIGYFSHSKAGVLSSGALLAIEAFVNGLAWAWLEIKDMPEVH